MNRVRYGYAAAARIMDYYEYNVRICLALLYPPQALVFMRVPSCGSMPPTAVTSRDPSQLEGQSAEDHTGPGSLNRPCHWDG